MENKILRVKELTEKLHKASVAYYQYDNPIYTDKQYDDMYDELEQLEKETGLILTGSPTQKVQGFILPGLEKQKHSKPMLSAAKTKNVDEINSQVEKQKMIPDQANLSSTATILGYGLINDNIFNTYTIYTNCTCNNK